jgi:hypothetical protein
MLCFSEARYKQDDAANKQYATQHRSKRDVVCLINSGVHRANIDQLFLRRVGNALVGKRNDRQNDENYSHDRYGLHLQTLSVAPVSRTFPPLYFSIISVG